MPHQDAQSPTLLPILSWGKRRDPRKGACFMEFASLTGDDLHIEARIALGSAIMALPVVTAKRQRLMAVSVLSCDRVLAELDGRPVGALEAPSRAALAQAPRAARYASRLVGGPEEKPIWGNGFRKTAAPALARTAAAGIARSGVPDPDGMLRDLLVQAIDVCTTWGGAIPTRAAARSATGPGSPDWRAFVLGRPA